MKLSPTRGKIVVENILDSKQTPGGIILADSTREVPHRGRVIAIGKPFIDQKFKEHAWDVKIGDIVHFKRKWSEFKNTHFILLHDDFFAIEKEESGKLTAPRDLIIVDRVYTGQVENSTIIIPETYGVKENHEDFYGSVISVGRDDKFGIKYGQKILYHRNEGLCVMMPSRKEYWSLKPRAILAEITS